MVGTKFMDNTFVYLLVWLGQALLFGFLSNGLACQKNCAHNYFATGFFLGFIGFLYVGFLPNFTEENPQKVDTSSRFSAPEENSDEDNLDSDFDNDNDN